MDLVSVNGSMDKMAEEMLIAIMLTLAHARLHVLSYGSLLQSDLIVYLLFKNYYTCHALRKLQFVM